MNIKIVKANYTNEKDAEDIVKLMSAYAQDKMGGSEDLTSNVKMNLVKTLAKRSDAYSVLAYDGDLAVGLVNCFEGFSTFACKPLVNIHDIIVLDTHRGIGINQQMLKEVEIIAMQRGACKLTLEVLEGNEFAKGSYSKFGFSAYTLDKDMGNAHFWQKNINSVLTDSEYKLNVKS